MNSSVNYGLWVISKCQCRSLRCKGTTLVWGVHSGEAWGWGAGGAGKLPVLSTPFCCDPKTELKKWSQFKKKKTPHGKTPRKVSIPGNSSPGSCLSSGCFFMPLPLPHSSHTPAPWTHQQFLSTDLAWATPFELGAPHLSTRAAWQTPSYFF